jgi:alkyldihydroxyacetonephosphate synthase
MAYLGSVADRRRRLGGWGFEGERHEPPGPLLAWLEERLGRSDPFPVFDPSRVVVPAPRPLPSLGATPSSEVLDRLAHARGQGLPDLLRIRSGRVPAAPDAVVRPLDEGETAAVLLACARAGVRVIPWGGGTSVTGGVNVLPTEQPAVTIDLERVAGLTALDEHSGLATFGAGTLGPAIETALAPAGLTLGHFPQSWELSSLGGWIVTRSSGQESLGYGSIADLVAGLTLAAPGDRLDLRALPATAAGPDLRALVLGSEGRLGIVTRATVRVRPRPAVMRVTGTVVPSWDAGLEAAREILRGRVPLTLLRLSDETESAVAVTLGLAEHRVLGTLARGWLAARGIRGGGCLVLLGAAGGSGAVRRSLSEAAGMLRRQGGVPLGARPGRRWLADRFRQPYLRDALLDRGIATDTLETAAPWSALAGLAAGVRTALGRALGPEGERVVTLCHVSHPYADGASLYFTVFFRCPSDPERAVARWATLKRAATQAIVAGGGTVTHHHGVGSWHAPWLGGEVGATGLRVLSAAAAALDPAGILNPHVLLDPTDRLEA